MTFVAFFMVSCRVSLVEATFVEAVLVTTALRGWFGGQHCDVGTSSRLHQVIHSVKEKHIVTTCELSSSTS